MSLEIKEFEPLAQYTTFKIGGAARFFVEATTETEIVAALKSAEENCQKVFILGGGSNILIADAGFDGLVIKIALRGIIFEQQDDEKVLVTAGAGENWDELVEICIRKNLQGFECLSGIPGLVGGTPVQNVGAYGQEISETVFSVKVLERSTGKVFDLPAESCNFSYRASIFNTTQKNNFIVLAVTFKLKLNGQAKIVYKDLREYFWNYQPNLLEVREAVLKIRQSKSMVIDHLDPNFRSAGSFFKNPIVDIEKYELIKANSSEPIPHFIINQETVKIPAAWLIENSGFTKGFRIKDVGISTKHSLAIVNFGRATAADVLSLMNEIQHGVEKKFGILLQPEPVFVGF